MKLLYFDCFNGASGDMILGALLDAGLPLDELRRALGSLGIGEYELAAERVLRAGVSATKFHLIERAGGDASAATQISAPHVHAHQHSHTHSHGDAPSHEHSHSHPHEHSPSGEHSHAHSHGDAPSHEHSHAHTHLHEHSHRSLPEIVGLIERSALPPAGRARARQLFERLAEAEAAIHQMPVERVHLHEVGALDSIIDIVGAVFAIEWFGAERIVVSPLNVGAGMVRSAHGLFPVPAPATLRLLGDAPIYSSGVQAELLTPTGALLLTSHANAFGPVPQMRVDRVGYGAGTRELAGTPNVLRVLVGESMAEPTTERIVVLECEIDDMNPQIFGVLMDRLYAAGALEVYYSAVQMKKNRPGTLITVLAAPDRREALAGIVFRESTTIGIRYRDVQRERLEREVVGVETPFGTVRCKVARRNGQVVNASPEFDDCVRVATERGIPVKDVHAAAVHAWLGRS
jgi:pyridinium-3,5-bisthiocarboxylic acid mononucleotide nickel chelatase